MRLLSNQVRYAICGIFDLAYNADHQPVQLRVIGERQGIPPRYLEQIFQRLRRAGLVTGKRGPGGGYSLLLAASEISLRAVVEAVEGPIGSASQGEDAAREVESGQTACGPEFLWSQIAEGFAALLDETTVEDLCQQAARRGIRRAGAEFLSYQI